MFEDFMVKMESEKERHKRYICSFQGCGAAYNRQWKLDSHLCKHTGVKPHTCGLQGCGKSFSSPYHLARHELIHSGDKPFPCTVEGCTEAFTTNSNRQRHISRHESRRYVCPEESCGLEFRKNKLLKAHMCEQHSNAPQCRCPFEGCTMSFSVPSKLQRHQKVHRGYPCQEAGCGFTGRTWTDLVAHRRKHRARFGCDQCAKTFADPWNLRQHQRVHSDTRLVLICPWDGCDRTFTTAFNLQSHIGSFHEEQKPFSCLHPGCGRSFAMKQSLTRHGVMHDPQRKKIRKTQRKRSLASRLSGFKDPKPSNQPSSDPKPSNQPSSDPKPSNKPSSEPAVDPVTSPRPGLETQIKTENQGPSFDPDSPPGKIPRWSPNPVQSQSPVQSPVQCSDLVLCPDQSPDLVLCPDQVQDSL